MSASQERLAYSDVRCPSIGQTLPCKPFVAVVVCGATTYRLVLTGKRGLPGYADEPMFAVEQQYEPDALGNPVWVRRDLTALGDETIVDIVGRLLVLVAS